MLNNQVVNQPFHKEPSFRSSRLALSQPETRCLAGTTNRARSLTKKGL